MSGTLDVLDAHVIRVPFDALKRAAKDRKGLIDKISDVVSNLNSTPQVFVNPLPTRDVDMSIASSADVASDAAGCSPEQDCDAMQTDDPGSAHLVPADTISTTLSMEQRQALQALEELSLQLGAISQSLTTVSETEATTAAACEARLGFLSKLGPQPQPAKASTATRNTTSLGTSIDNSAGSSPPAGLPWKTGVLSQTPFLDWNRQGGRLDFLLMDHLYRCGYFSAAAMLEHEAGLIGLCDVNIFRQAREVSQALQNKDCSIALKWCDDNSSRLKKIKSKLEFDLRVQEFIELVRRDERLNAIHYARQHLAPWAGLYMKELQQTVTTLALTSNTKCEPYKSLFLESRWQGLVELFHKDMYSLHGLPRESPLMAHLQAGLSALNTPQSLQDGCNREDPLHLPAFQKLAKNLPYAKHVSSKLICSVTKHIMDDANPPMVLPNGYVYSSRAVEKLLVEGNGKLTCPKTCNVYNADELRRAFIV
ncbi:hypothetical protein CEUSTIGMA_g8093.t1 [Chlamydomonas eustigma]|uniref:CTLH domain-containing protein n=1 Tax=Chlamydomonas eustigma TaxID=1157962 RepID=A0A250XC55_9CHLO|nr:hypothetical protein CEUSTIGMA_g8093.t1 [Chlamydomonas eustigma]|eukprot:GAX80658.1 hypothetical protein CEUSTIGMA_g8093.t1 [Chlamydomonas eustigma]